MTKKKVHNVPASNKITIPVRNYRFASCFFCEDVRNETTGQISLVGVYADNEIVLPKPLPKHGLTILKLAVAVSVSLLPDDDFPDAKLMIEFPGGNTREGPISLPAPSNPEMKEHAAYMSAFGLIQMQMVNISEEGTILVYLDLGKEVLFAGGLNVVFRSE